MTAQNDIQLLNLFIFNPTLSTTEDEEDLKILYFFPSQTDKDSQLKKVGLCEALIKFTASFNPAQPCRSFFTQKTKQFLFQPEPNFWYVMIVGVPSVKVGWNTEYQGDKVQENVYSAVLKQSYRMFQLFYGSFSSVLNEEIDDSNVNLLKTKLKTFYDDYLVNLKLENCDILDVFQGISFLPLGKEPFLHVQSFVNLVETNFDPVRYSAFLYNDQLVWSSIHLEDMQVIYQYLVYSLLPSHLELELQGGSLPRSNNSTVHHYGSFVTGPPNLRDSVVSSKKVPKVYLNNNAKHECFHLVVYRALSATLCLFIDEKEILTLDLFKDLDSYLGPQLTSLVSEVAEHYSRYTALTSMNESGPKVICYNKLNLAQKSTVHLGNRKNGKISVPEKTLRVIADINDDKKLMKQEDGEVFMKGMNETWLVGKFCNYREFYVIVNHKKASLVEISDEVKKLFENRLKGIFFGD